MKDKIKIIIGLEIHLELMTARKAFSNSPNTSLQEPNTFVNERDLGYPGTLPIVEEELIEKGITACSLMNMSISKKISFDRKHYLYPDLPKGFQITQFYNPIGTNGSVILETGKKINIIEAHLEEDTAKRIYTSNEVLVDYNRAGKPLLEIVTAPDFESGEEVIEFLTWVRQSMINSEVSKATMEAGSLRCDVNINLKGTYNNKKVCTGISEIKNINSFRNILQAISFEAKRHMNIIEGDLSTPRQTRKFDEKTKETIQMRIKDTIEEYFFIPEPNLIPFSIPSNLKNEALLKITENQIVKGIKETDFYIPYYSLDTLKKEISDLGKHEVSLILGRLFFSRYLKGVLNFSDKKFLKQAVKWALNDFSELLKEKNDDSINMINLVLGVRELYLRVQEKKILSSKIKTVLANLIDNRPYKKLVKSVQLEENRISEEQILLIIKELVENNMEFINANIVQRESRVLKMIMGLTMKRLKGKAHPQEVMELVKKEINKRDKGKI